MVSQAKEPFHPLPWAYLLVGLSTLDSNLHIANNCHKPIPQAKEPFHPLPWAYLLVGLGALNSSLHLVNGWMAAAVLCTITVLAYLHYVTTVVNQVRVCWVCTE